jgi:hypothetical protein
MKAYLVTTKANNRGDHLCRWVIQERKMNLVKAFMVTMLDYVGPITPAVLVRCFWLVVLAHASISRCWATATVHGIDGRHCLGGFVTNTQPCDVRRTIHDWVNMRIALSGSAASLADPKVGDERNTNLSSQPCSFSIYI